MTILSSTSSKKFFRPRHRGSLAISIQKHALSKIAPASPRPSVLLDGVSMVSDTALSAADISIYEFLLSAAYEADQQLSTPTVAVSVANILKFLGTSARRPALKAALKRLNATTMDFGNYEQLPLIISWLECTDNNDVVSFGFPPPVRELMRRMPSYAYIELAALSSMKSAYSSRLYKKLALEASKVKWTAGGKNEVLLSGTPEDVAAWSGFEPENGKISMSRLRDRVLKYVDIDMKNLRAFTVSFREHYGTGRGRPVEKIEFRLGILPPSHHLVKTPAFKKDEHNKRGIGGVDADQYRVNSHIWVKAQNEFWTIQKRSHDLYFKAWQVALQEALDEASVSPGYTRREYRGRRLLNAISSLGTDEAAFKFCAEEVDNPDILEAASPDLTVDATEAENARKARIEAREYAQAYFVEPKVRYPVYTRMCTPTETGTDLGECNARSVTLPLNHVKHSFARPAAKPAPAKIETSAFEEVGIIEMSDVAADMLEDLISDPVIADPQEPVLGQNVTLAEASEVIWTADRSLNLDEVQAEIFPVIQNHDFSGPKNLRLTVRCWVDGSVEEYSFGKHDVSAADIAYITNRLKNDRVLDDDFQTEEYVR